MLLQPLDAGRLVEFDFIDRRNEAERFRDDSRPLSTGSFFPPEHRLVTGRTEHIQPLRFVE